MSAVDQDQQLHAAGTSVIEQRIERGANRAPRVEHVIDQDDVASVYVEAQRTGSDDRPNVARGEIVAIEGYVKRTGVDGVLLDSGNQRCQALGQRHAAPL